MKLVFRYHDIEVSGETISGFCRRWRITKLSFFGSILRPNFGPESDIDVLVTFAPDAQWCFGDFLRMEEELESLLGHPVDLVERGAVEQSANYIRRKHILSHLEPVYVA